MCLKGPFTSQLEHFSVSLSLGGGAGGGALRVSVEPCEASGSGTEWRVECSWNGKSKGTATIQVDEESDGCYDEGAEHCAFDSVYTRRGYTSGESSVRCVCESGSETESYGGTTYDLSRVL